MIRVLSVSSSRADVGILAPVWEALVKNQEVELHLLITGMHLVDDKSLREMLPSAVLVHKGGADLGGAGPEAVARAMATIGSFTSNVVAEVEPDSMLITGDRLDMVPTALAAVPFNIPLVHLHGGELSQGALDDRIRHAITKLSHLHCVSTVEAAERVSQMGEESWRIHVTGAPGLDTLLNTAEMSAESVHSALGLPTLEGLRLVTVHPETNSSHPASPLDAVLTALQSSPGPSVFTAPNSDPGGTELLRRIEDFVGMHPWAVFHNSLGAVLYANVLRHAAVMVGNSSSGIIEAASFGLPVINVGSRQRGRKHGRNVHNCSCDPAEVMLLLDKISANRERRDTFCDNLYGDGCSGPRIAAVLTDLPDRQRLLFKQFTCEETKFFAPWNPMGHSLVRK